MAYGNFTINFDDIISSIPLRSAIIGDSPWNAILSEDASIGGKSGLPDRIPSILGTCTGNATPANGTLNTYTSDSPHWINDSTEMPNWEYVQEDFIPDLRDEQAERMVEHFRGAITMLLEERLQQDLVLGDLSLEHTRRFRRLVSFRGGRRLKL